jgi:hypothetical protein
VISWSLASVPTSLWLCPGSAGQLGGRPSQIGPNSGFEVGGGVVAGVGLGAPGTGVRLGAAADGDDVRTGDGDTVAPHPAMRRPMRTGATRRMVAVTRAS